MKGPSDRNDKGPLQPQTVEDLLRIQGYPPLEDDVVTRIAAGGANAARAVVAARRGSTFDADPGTYLSELERLGGPDDT